jgi:hypothetical protein
VSRTFFWPTRLWFAFFCVAGASACSSQDSIFSRGLTKPPTVVNFTIPQAQFKAAALGLQTELTLSLSVSGGYRPSLLAQTLPEPFAWVGGSFPGTGGTCRADRIMNGCTLRVAFTPSVKGVFTKTLSLSYQGGAESTETLDLALWAATPAELVLRSPSSVALGDAVVGYNSPVVLIEVEHLSGAPASDLGIAGSTTGITFEGGHFPGTTGTCPQTLVSGSCKVALVLTPSQSGSLIADAAISFDDGAQDQALVTTLTATVRHPAKLRASPSNNSLGRIYLGGYQDFPITLTYLEGDHDANGLALLGLAGEVTFAGGSYPGTGGNCPNSISAGSCTIMLRAQPASLGLSTRQLRIAYRSGSIWAYADTALSWESAQPAVLSWEQPFTPSSTVNFGTVAVGASSQQELWLEHVAGDTSATQLQLQLPTGYSRLGGSCGSSLSQGSRCSLLIGFTPTTNGVFTGNLTLQYQNGGTSASLSRPLTGTTEAKLGITPATGHSFGTLAVGALATQVFTITHVGGVPATGLSPSISGAAPGLSVSATTCGASLSQASCTVTVSLQPTQVGALSGSLVLQFGNGLFTDQVSVPLSANVVPPATLGLSTPALDFGTTVAGGSITRTLRLTYASGGAPATAITALNLAAPFSLSSNGCASGLQSVGQTCDLTFLVQPASAGTHSRTITLRYHDGATTRSETVSLTTSALAPAVLTVDGASPISFGIVQTGSSSSQLLTLRHLSGGVSATAITATPPTGFRYVGGSFPGSSGNCTSTLAIGQSCTLHLEFAPTTRGTFNPNLSIGYHDGAAGRATTKSLLGYTESRITASIGTALAFGARATGSLHTQSFLIQHAGGVGATELSASVSGTGFSLISTTCSGSLFSSSCSVNVGFQPSAMVSYSGSFTLSFNNGFSSDSFVIPITGTGSTPALLELSGTTAVPGTPVNGSSTDLSLTLRNVGGAPATSISSVSPSAVFRYKGNTFPGTGGTCGTTLGVGAQCTLVLVFAPTATGSHSATVVVNYHNGNSATSVSAVLSGSSVPPAVLALSQSLLSFAVTPAGGSSTHDLIILKTAGTGPASNLRFSGLGAPFSFNQGAYPGTGGDCAPTITAISSCTLRFAFSPANPLRSTAPITLTYFDGLVDRVLSFSLSGYTPAQYTLSPVAGINLGERAIHGSHTATFTLTREGGPASVTLAASLSGAGFSFAGGAGFPGAGGTCAAAWTGSSCTLSLSLAPNTLGLWSGTLSLHAETHPGNTASFSRSVSLMARNPALLGSPDSLITFPDTAPGSSSQEIIILENSGELSVTSMAGAITSSGFEFVGGSYPGTGGTCGAALASQNSCTVLVRFSPPAAQTYLSNLMIAHHDGAQNLSFSLPLRGTGTGASVAGKTSSRLRSIPDQDQDGLTDQLLDVGADTLAVISGISGAVVFEASPPLGLGSLDSYSVWGVADLNGDFQNETLWQWTLLSGAVVYEVREGGTGRILNEITLEPSMDFSPLKFTALGSPSWNALRFEDGRTWGPWDSP